MKVQEIMTVNPEKVQATDTVAHAAELMEKLDVGVLPVYDRDEPVGIVTDRDIALRLVAKSRHPEETNVGEIMTAEVIFCTEDMDIERAAEIMEYKKIRRLLVKNEEGAFTGILSLGDLAMSLKPDESGEVLQEVSGVAAPNRI
jgi:CBS domain-containing protein